MGGRGGAHHRRHRLVRQQARRVDARAPPAQSAVRAQPRRAEAVGDAGALRGSSVAALLPGRRPRPRAAGPRHVRHRRGVPRRRAQADPRLRVQPVRGHPDQRAGRQERDRRRHRSGRQARGGHQHRQGRRPAQPLRRHQALRGEAVRPGQRVRPPARDELLGGALRQRHRQPWQRGPALRRPARHRARHRDRPGHDALLDHARAGRGVRHRLGRADAGRRDLRAEDPEHADHRHGRGHRARLS